MFDVGYDAYDIVSPVSIPNDIRKQKSGTFERILSRAWDLLIPLTQGRFNMKSIYSSNTPGGVLLALFLLFGIAIISSTTAQAQWPWGNGQNRSDRDRDERIRRERERQRNRDDRYRRDRNTGVYDPYGTNGT